MAQDSIMLALGNYRFSVSTAAFQTLQRTTEYRWAKLDTVGSRPKYQPIGIGEETITLDGIIYPHYAGGIAQLDAMRAEASTMQPLSLRSNKKLGQWAIKKITENQAQMLGDIPIKQEFSIELIFIGR